MKRIFTLLFPLLFLSGIVSAQSKQYSMEDAVLGLSGNLAPETIKGLAWIPNTNTFTRLDEEQTKLTGVSVPSMQEKTLFSLKTINEQLFAQNPLKHIPSLQWLDANSLYFRRDSSYYIGEKVGQVWQFKFWVQLPEKAENRAVDADTRLMTYTLDNNLYLANRRGEIKAITQESNKAIISGQIVSRNEFGIDQGVFVSPKGSLIAFYQKDESAVEDYPVIDWTVVPAKNHNVKYPMAGRSSEIIHLGVYNPATQETIFLETGDHTDHYLTGVTWSPDDQYLFVIILERNQKSMILQQYNAQTGKFVRSLFKETDEKYVRPLHGLSFIPGTTNEFVYWTAKDGYTHLYRYNTQGNLLNQITSGAWEVNEIHGWIPAKKEIIISSTKVSPLNKNVYAVNWTNGRLRRLDQAEGMHAPKVNTQGTFWLNQYSNYDEPNTIKVASSTGRWQKTLLKSTNPLKNYQQAQVRQLTLTAADGATTLYGRLILPPDFDSTKKYPVIVYLYNGPGLQLLHNRFPASGNLWYDYMAQRGYLIFTMDGRGSSNRGKDFEQATFRHLGTEEMADQLVGVNYLKSLPFVDGERLGVHGWSYGGFMTTSLMLHHPGVFKVAVAGGPVMDWSMYEVMYTERYMDTPQENPEGYANTNLIDKVQNLKGKLLLIHGAQDATVVWQHSMRFLRSSVEQEKQVDYFVYPIYPHNVRGKDRVHLMQKITDYFDDYLKN